MVGACQGSEHNFSKFPTNLFDFGFEFDGSSTLFRGHAAKRDKSLTKRGAEVIMYKLLYALFRAGVTRRKRGENGASPRTKNVRGNRNGNRKRIFVQELFYLRRKEVDSAGAVRAYRRGRRRVLLARVQDDQHYNVRGHAALRGRRVQNAVLRSDPARRRRVQRLRGEGTFYDRHRRHAQAQIEGV